MKTHDAHEFLRSLPKMRALLAFDLGEKTIGLALSDRMWTVATAMKTLKRRKFTQDAQEIGKLIKAHEIGGLVLGWPLHMDGRMSARTQSAQSFAVNLENSWGADMPPLLFWDERLSTMAAERTMLEADLSRKKRAEKIDALAAAFILQGALDRLQNILKDTYLQ